MPQPHEAEKITSIRLGGRDFPAHFIAAGGMAWVFEVTHPTTGARLALKMLSGEGRYEFHKFEAEVKILASIDHPNLVRVHDFGVDEQSGRYCYTMAFIEGPTLARRLDEPASTRQLVKLFDDVLTGVSVLHRHPKRITHRDIKPANILIQRGSGAGRGDERALVADLGIARVGEDPGATQLSSLTIQGTGPGTLRYVALEQALGDPSPASDVFSLGLTIFEAFAGAHLYKLMQLDDKRILNRLLELRSAGQQLPIEFPAEARIEARFRKKLLQFLRRACDMRPDQRFPDAVEMRRAWREVFRDAGPRTIPLWARVAAGVLAVGGAAWWIGNSMRIEQRAKALEAHVGELEGVLQALIAQLDQGPVPLSAPRRAKALQLFDKAHNYIADGAVQMQAEGFETAVTFFSSAERDLAASCAEIATGHLLPIALDRTRATRARLEKLRSSGAVKSARARGAELESRVESLALPEEDAPACDAAEAGFALIQNLVLVEQQMDEIDAGFYQTLVAEVAAAKDSANEARSRAESAPVEQEAYRAALELGRRAFDDGDRFQKAFQPSDALPAYREAEKAFSSARRTADEQQEIASAAATAKDELERAQLAARSATEEAKRAGAQLKDGGRCDALGAPAARDACARADAALESALAALENGGVPTASEQSRVALAGYREASEAEARLPRPPQIEKILPEDAALTAYRNAALQFKVTASDVNGDPLAYRWTFDDEPLDATSPVLNLRAAQTGRVEVTVADASGGSDSHRWQISVENRRPKLRVTPASDPSLAAGESVAFSADATDPDGDPIEIEYRLDGQAVAADRYYKFQAGSPGTQQLEVVATDAAGASASATRRIRVLPSEEAWKQAVRRAIEESYERALNERSQARFEEIFPGGANDLYGGLLLTKLSGSDAVVSAKLQDATQLDASASQVKVKFSHHEEGSLDTADKSCEATLAKAATGYQIQKGSFRCR